VLAAPYALFLVFDKEARRALATPGPWLGMAVALLVMAPHLVWLFQTDFLPFAYVEARAAPLRGWYDHIYHPVAFLAGQFVFALPALLIAGAVVWPGRGNAPLPPVRLGIVDDAFERRIVTLIAFGPALAMIVLTAVSGRGTVSDWGTPLWLFVGLWTVMNVRLPLGRDRLARAVAAWGAVFAGFAIVFAVNYTVLPLIDHRYRAAFFPGKQIAADLTQRFRAATGAPLRYVIGSIWDAGEVGHYSKDQPQVLIDGLPGRAPWIDLKDLRVKGALVVWTVGDPTRLPAQFVPLASGAEVGEPLTLPMNRGYGEVHVGWAILKPQ
jgi:hypothetical protein